jgi:uncharacterized membrane protein YfcA
VFAVAIAAAAQAVTAVGFSLIAVPFVSLATGVAAGVPTVNVLAAGLNIVMLHAERHGTRWRDALWLFVPAAVVIPFVAYGIRRLSPDTLSVITGSVILVAAALLATGVRAPSLRRRRGAMIGGALSGGMNVAAGVGGPPAAMYAINADWPAAAYRPTLQAYFLGINIVSAASRGFAHFADAKLFVALAAAIPLGWLVGRQLTTSVDDKAVRNLTLAFAAVGGVVAVARGLL